MEKRSQSLVRSSQFTSSLLLMMDCIPVTLQQKHPKEGRCGFQWIYVSSMLSHVHEYNVYISSCKNIHLVQCCAVQLMLYFFTLCQNSLHSSNDYVCCTCLHYACYISQLIQFSTCTYNGILPHICKIYIYIQLCAWGIQHSIQTQTVHIDPFTLQLIMRIK